jgi:hypothetical protein
LMQEAARDQRGDEFGFKGGHDGGFPILRCPLSGGVV